jgi:dTDP-4-dehydrorhamnose 3,5-epimerase
MKITDTKIAGVHVIETTAHADHRGSFARGFCARELAPVLGGRTIVQINLSKTATAGAVRGMHYQNAPHAELKMVRCLRGRMMDVALDLRHGSPTFLQWHAEELSPGNMKMMLIPEGCAHGFQSLEPDTEVLYLHTQFYEPSSEGGVNHTDPRCAITWPLPVTDISARDTNYPMLGNQFQGI